MGATTTLPYIKQLKDRFSYPAENPQMGRIREEIIGSPLVETISYVGKFWATTAFRRMIEGCLLKSPITLGNYPLNHVFVSYVRENQNDVERLRRDLQGLGINIWLDREQIRPGQRWKDAIRSAIANGAFFIGCFSEEYDKRDKSYMNEELLLAIEELRKKPKQRSWFIPVVLPGGSVPDRQIGGGETLQDLQWVNLDNNWEEGIRKIFQTINPDFKNTFEIQTPEKVSDSVYANLIDSAVKLCGLNGWEFWTGLAMGDDPSWEQSNIFQAFEFRKKIIAAKLY